jgi:uncharacterized membrane protein
MTTTALTFYTPQRILLILGAVAGLILVFLTPPFQAADEFAHFYRAYHVSSGQALARLHDHRVGAELPSSLVETADQSGFQSMPFRPENKMRRVYIDRVWALDLAPDDRVFVDFPNTALYSPWAYAPQAIGMAFASLFDPPPILLLYLGRLTNLAFWLFLVVTAVRLTPVGSWLLAILAIMPLSIFQAASLSPDAMTFGLSFLLTALGLRVSLRATQDFRWRTTLGWAALAAALALTKFAYLFLSFVFFLPAWSHREASVHRRIVRQGLIVVGLAGTAWLAWTLIARGLFLTYDQYHPLFRDRLALMKGVNPDAQWNLVLGAPLAFLTRVMYSLLDQRIWELTIAQLGWLDIVFPSWFIYGYWLWLVATALTDGSGESALNRGQRMWAAFIVVASALFFCLLSYLQWSPVGWPRIFGLQGRYMIPMLPLALLLLTPHRPPPGSDSLRARVHIAGMLFSLGMTLYLVAERYY